MKKRICCRDDIVADIVVCHTVECHQTLVECVEHLDVSVCKTHELFQTHQKVHSTEFLNCVKMKDVV